MTTPAAPKRYDDFGASDRPPALSDMFINSIDTLRNRTINQKIPLTWNDKPPLLQVSTSKRQSFLWRHSTEDIVQEEDQKLLKGVSLSL